MPAIWVTVMQAQGSVPRGAGTVMAIFADEFLGTIGGGHLEFEAIALARLCLQSLQLRQRCPLKNELPWAPA